MHVCKVIVPFWPRYGRGYIFIFLHVLMHVHHFALVFFFINPLHVTKVMGYYRHTLVQFLLLTIMYVLCICVDVFLPHKVWIKRAVFSATGLFLVLQGCFHLQAIVWIHVRGLGVVSLPPRVTENRLLLVLMGLSLDKEHCSPLTWESIFAYQFML